MKTSSIEQVAKWLRFSRRIVVLSGAGLSKASGIPTYRDADGLWGQGNNLKFSDAASFEADPRGFLAFWAARRTEVGRAQPNAGHHALAELQRLRPLTMLVTQNVDGLLGRAGAGRVLELHGNLALSRCTACNVRNPAEREGHCLACSAPAPTVRPAVVMFGEQLDPRTLAEAEFVSRQSEVFLSVGTTSLVHPAAGLSERAQALGARLVVVNVEQTIEHRTADAVLLGPAEEILPRLVELVRGRG
jgi:NAD-dependent deacetylase